MNGVPGAFHLQHLHRAYVGSQPRDKRGRGEDVVLARDEEHRAGDAADLGKADVAATIDDGSGRGDEAGVQPSLYRVGLWGGKHTWVAPAILILTKGLTGIGWRRH